MSAHPLVMSYDFFLNCKTGNTLPLIGTYGKNRRISRNSYKFVT